MILASLLAATEAAGWPPTQIASWDVSGGNAMAIDADGEMFAVVPGDGHVILAKYSATGEGLVNIITGPGGSFQTPKGIAVDAEGLVYLADTYASRIQVFDNDLLPIATWSQAGWLDYPEDIEIGADDRVYVKAQQTMEIFSRSGEPLDRWPVEGSLFSIEDSGNLLVADQAIFRRYSPLGSLLEKMGGRHFFTYPTGLAVYPHALLVATGADSVLAFDEHGIYRGSFHHRGATLLARGPHDNIYVNGLTLYEPPGELPPPPAPDPSASSAVMLHISPVKDPWTACGEGPVSTTDIVTEAAAKPDGTARYFVYLLAAPRSPGEGILGVQLGIEHTGAKEPPTPLRILDWHACSDAEWPDDTWPGSGVGNTLTWISCQYAPLVAVGTFYVVAYAPASMAISGFPATGVVKTSNCSASEDVSDQTLGFDRVGWVSMGGAARGLDRDGCNPGVEPCLQQPVPIRPTTWGRVKGLYRN